ncbi:MAG: trypsin-like peptidase domain-containing protein [Pseudobdellovibrionaceae bacterium]
MKLLLSVIMILLVSCGQSPDDGAPEGSDPRTDRRDLETKVIYGSDDRKDLYQVNENLWKNKARSTVALIKNSDLRSRGNLFDVSADSYGSQQNLCRTEPFYDQPAGAFCSGSLVAPNIIMTAGHCLRSASDCGSTSFVFDYAVLASGQYPNSVSSAQVYRCKRILVSQVLNSGYDYALVEIDRSVSDRSPLNLSPKAVLSQGEPLTVIGHPSGLPTKVASGGRVRKVTGTHYVTDLDTYGGNSGSAVFDSQNGEVIGILVRGENDFLNQGNCTVSNRCAQESCRGEDVTRIDVVKRELAQWITPSPSTTSTTVPQQPFPSREFVSNSRLAIPDNQLQGVTSSLNVSEASQGRRVLVAVDISHSYIGDLRIELISPDQQVYRLRTNQGGRTRDLRGVFGESLTSESDLSSLSQAPAGIYRLRIIDSLARDTGSLLSWKLILKP